MNIESYFIKNAKSGDTMYSEKKDNNIQALASHYNVKIKTERITAIDKNTNTKITQLLKITIQ